MNTTSSRIASRQGTRLTTALAALALSAVATGCAYDAQAPLDEEVAAAEEQITNAPRTAHCSS